MSQVSRHELSLRIGLEADRLSFVGTNCQPSAERRERNVPGPVARRAARALRRIGTFTDPSFPQPTVSVYGVRRYPWLSAPDGLEEELD
jgi:hypothetical protein